MKFWKPLLLITICLGFFFYGMASLQYRIFPYKYLIAVKHYISHKQDQNQSTEVINTFFQRLLMKKVFIDSDLFRGGGLANIDQYIFITTNKGKLYIFDNKNYTKIRGDIENVPLKWDELKRANHHKKNDFKPPFFRVSGMYAEPVSQNIYRLFVTHHTYDSKNDCVLHNISRIDLEIADSSAVSRHSWQTIFSGKPCIDLEPEHFSTNEPFVGQEGGGKIIEYNDSTLMVSVGEYGRNDLNNTENFSQDPDVPYGKIILVDKNTGAWSVYAMGLRNALGLFKSEDGIIWETENGPRGGDELNIIEKGNDYGWPEVSYGVWYNADYKLNDSLVRGSHEGYNKPVFAWTPSIAPNNLTRIEGEKFKHWEGDLIIGTMADRSLHRVRLSEDNKVIYTERIFISHRVRDLITLSDDSIALITDDGFLIILDDGGSVFTEMSQKISQRKAALNKYSSFSSGSPDDAPRIENRATTAKAIFEQHCGNCHNITNESSIGPHLNSLFGRKVGSLRGFNYSKTLIDDERSWNASLLRSFLLEPEEEFPNTQMSKVYLTTSEADSIVSYLKK